MAALTCGAVWAAPKVRRRREEYHLSCNRLTFGLPIIAPRQGQALAPKKQAQECSLLPIRLMPQVQLGPLGISLLEANLLLEVEPRPPGGLKQSA
jgi:hypothetical protein